MSRKQRIEQLIQARLNPSYLNVENESGNHNVPEGSETHFKLTIVTEQFIPFNRVARHRLINHLLTQEFAQELHALSLHLFTPEEWKKKNSVVSDSPACRDGYKNKQE